MFVSLFSVCLEVYITLIKVNNVFNSLCLNLTIQRKLSEKKELFSR